VRYLNRHHTAKLPAAGVFVAIMCFSGCATRYGEIGFMGGVQSFPSQRPDIEAIWAERNGLTSTSRLREFVLLKSAQDCLTRGYDKFVVMLPQTPEVSGADESETSETEGLDGVAGVDPRLRISVKKWDAIVVVRFFKATAVVDASALRPASRWSQPMDAAAIARVLGERFAPAETLPKAIPDQYLVPLRTAEEPPKPSVVSAPVAAQALEPANASPVPQTTTPAKTIAVSETAFDSTSFGLQIGSYKLNTNAAAARAEFLRRHPQIRSSQIVESLLLGTSPLYRLRVGGLAAKRDAVALCDSLKADGGDCFVVHDTPPRRRASLSP
jgi:cell division septation protein DedD